MKKYWKFLVMVSLFVLGTTVVVFWKRETTEKLSYLDSMDEVILTVDEREIKLRELAFYIAYQEGIVQEQAGVYNPENKNSYWNLHIGGGFIKNRSKEAVIHAAVHDEIFYQLSQKEELGLTEEEEQYELNAYQDFWEDLEEEQREKLGVSSEELKEMIHRITLAQKQQQFVAAVEGVDYEDYNMDGDAYKELLKEHTYDVRETIWDRINYGEITVEH